MNIHKTAIIDPKAELADDVSVGPYTVINANVKIGRGTSIGPHCVIDEYTTIGKDCRISPHAVIGGISQDKKFTGEKSFIEIGDNNIIREFSTINRGTEKDSKTTIGSNNLFMAYSHIAHNCCVGNDIIIANCGTLGGHVAVEDRVVIGGLAGVHQFARIGKLSIIGGSSKVVQDIIPYSTADGHPAKIYTINSLGLERAGVSADIRDDLKKAFKIIFSMKLNIKNALNKIREEVPSSEEIEHLISFIESSERGIAR